MGQYCGYSTIVLFKLPSLESESDIFLICILLIVTLTKEESESDIKLPHSARVSDGAVL